MANLSRKSLGRGSVGTQKIGGFAPAQDRPNLWADNNAQHRLEMRFAGGLNENTDPDLNECSVGYNFTLGLNQRSFIPRQPFDYRATATNGGAINSFMQLTKRTNDRTTLVQAGNKIYQWDGATSFTDKKTLSDSNSLLRSAYWSLGDYLVITDLNLRNVLLTWNGSAIADMTHTGISGSLYAKFAIVYLNRVWLFNIKNDSDELPHMILACAFEDPTNWDIATRGGATTDGGDSSLTTGLEAFFLFVPDLKEINAVCLFQNVLIISTKEGQIFKLSGTQSKDFKVEPFFNTEPAIGVGQMAPIGNDVLYLRHGGAIAQLFATMTYGNVNIANLSKWLPISTNNLSTIRAIVYDINRQRVYLFIPDAVLVLFKDVLNSDKFSVARDASASSNLSPWSKYITDDVSKFNSNCGAYLIDPGTTNYQVFFGDSTGRVFAMYGGGAGDAESNPVAVLRRSRHVGADVLQPWPWTQENITGHLRYRRLTEVEATVSVEWDDEYNTANSSVMLKGPVVGDPAWYWGGNMYFGGHFYWNQGEQAVARVSSINLNPGGKGPGFYISISVPFTRPFQIDAVDFD